MRTLSPREHRMVKAAADGDPPVFGNMWHASNSYFKMRGLVELALGVTPPEGVLEELWDMKVEAKRAGAGGNSKSTPSAT